MRGLRSAARARGGVGAEPADATLIAADLAVRRSLRSFRLGHHQFGDDAVALRVGAGQGHGGHVGARELANVGLLLGGARALGKLLQHSRTLARIDLVRNNLMHEGRRVPRADRSSVRGESLETDALVEFLKF